MKPLPLRCRVIGALQLSPMSIGQLSSVLSANVHSVRHYVEELHGMKVISHRGIGRANRYPVKLWGANP